MDHTLPDTRLGWSHRLAWSLSSSSEMATFSSFTCFLWVLLLLLCHKADSSKRKGQHYFCRDRKRLYFNHIRDLKKEIQCIINVPWYLLMTSILRYKRQKKRDILFPLNYVSQEQNLEGLSCIPENSNYNHFLIHSSINIYSTAIRHQAFSSCR